MTGGDFSGTEATVSTGNYFPESGWYLSGICLATATLNMQPRF
jgi:hypothetical protein